MNQKKLHTIALFISFLVAMLPIVEAQQISGGNSQATTSAQQNTITTNIPRYSRQTIIDITGTTIANATTELYIKKAKKRQTNTNQKGEFTITGIRLPDKDNEIYLKANDTAGNIAEQRYTVTVDTELPKFKIINFTSVAAQQLINVKAETDKPITIKHIAKSTSDKTPPDKIQNLRKDRIEETGIAIAWDATTALDFFTYTVYRNNKRIATTATPYFTDFQINQDTSYDYRVNAADKNCNEGPLSDTLITKSLKSDKALIEKPEQTKLGCETEEKTMQVEHSGSFTIPIQLQEGTNEVTITATDLAGHIIKYTNTTTLDTLLPEIKETNIEQLSPTYIPDIKIKGVLNKKAIVFAYLNSASKPSAYTESNDDGTFEIPVQLSRTVKTTTSARRATIETGEGWENTIKLEAVDSAGRKTQTAQQKITYALCGAGSWFYVPPLGKPSPEKLTPRFVLQGIQQAGLLFNATYKGRYNVTIGQIDVKSTGILAPELEEEYDNGIVDVSLVTQIQNPKSILGYLQIMFRPWTFPENTEMTEYDKELNISMHRASSTGPKTNKGTAQTMQYKNCLVPGIGCAKLFLQIDIPFQEKIPRQEVDRMSQKTVTKYKLENRVQKVCVPIEIAMDYPVPPKLIPKNFLKKAIEFLDKAVDAIDTVLNPLTTVGTYVLYACLASTAWLYIDMVSEMWNCEAQEAFSVAEGIAGSTDLTFSKAVAEAGLCKAKYKDEALKKCETCRSKIENSRSFQYETLQPICDRVACPSAPTLQSHIRNKNNDDIEPVFNSDETKALVAANKATDDGSGLSEWKIGEQIWSGDDCAFGPYQKNEANLLALTYDAPHPRLGIKDIYDLTKGKASETSWPSKEDCKKYTRPAHPACCGVSYMREWEGACGPVPIADTFDELEQSTCLAAQKRMQKLEAEKEGLSCGGVLNAVAGFCEPNTGDEIIDPMPTYGIKYVEKPEGTAVSEDVYVHIVPANMFKSRLNKDSKTDYKIYRGYVATRFTTTKGKEEREKFTKPRGGGVGDRFELEVGTKTQAVSDGVELTEFFDQEKKESATKEQKRDRKTLIQEFYTKLCDSKPPEVKTSTCTRELVEELYDRIYDKIGTSDKEYIVKPDQEGLLRSVQCVCLPAVTGSLMFWRNVMGVVRDCMKSILLTGDGSEGVCKAMLSTYVCDMLFDIIKCFVQKFNAPGYGARASGGIGGFLGTFTNAGSEVQRRVQGRYGETALWKTMFVDRKLVHSICAFAFTGTWNFDASGIFSQTVEQIPLQSQGLMAGCTRQFVGFDPTTEPKGRTTWTYHFGVGLAAGADVQYELLLKCSAGFRCNPADGFKNGECDCNKIGERTITIFAPELQPNPLKKNDILNKEVFHTIKSTDSPDSSVRYDKAILKYSYLDPKSNQEKTEQAECDIRLTGGDAPNFCQADLFGYRCMFGVGESAVLLDKIEPIYTHQMDKTQAFGIGEDIKLSLHIKQQQPTERAKSAEGTKFILYQLKNEEGKVIDELTEQSSFLTDKRINEQGSFTKELKIEGQIDQRNFGAKTSAGFSQQKLEKGKVTRQPTDIISGFNSNEQIPYVIRFTNNGDTFSVYEGADVIKDGQFVVIGSEIVSGNTASQLNRPTTQPYTKTGETKQKTVSFTITELPKENIDVLLIKTAGTTQGACDGDESKRQPVQWTVEIEIHEANKFGKPTAQIAIDPSTGKQAKDEIKVNVVCIPGASISKIEPTSEEKRAKLKEEGKCDSRPYIKNKEQCYCGKETGKQEPNCGTEEQGAYCINGYCSKAPLCKPAENINDVIQENCVCGMTTILGLPAPNICAFNPDKTTYCCNTQKCVNDFNYCKTTTGTPAAITPSTSATTPTAVTATPTITPTTTTTSPYDTTLPSPRPTIFTTTPTTEQIDKLPIDSSIKYTSFRDDEITITRDGPNEWTLVTKTKAGEERKSSMMTTEQIKINLVPGKESAEF